MSVLVRTLSIIVLLLGISSLCSAASPVASQIAKDFTPISGYVVQANSDDYLIDLGIGQGTAVGDIFSVSGPGEPITHPVTGKLLGTQERLKGLLRLTRLKSGYAHSQSIGPVDSIKRGDVINRFQELQALFWDYTAQGEQLAKELRTALPALQWKEYSVAQQQRPAMPERPKTFSPTIYFILTSQGLAVRAPDFELIHNYPVAIPQSATTLPAAHQPAAQQAALPMLTALPPVTGGAVRQGGEPLWNTASLKGTPVGVEIADFDGDGNLEAAIAFNDRIEIGRLNADGYQMLGAIRLDAGSQAYSLEAADLNANGRPELYVSAMNSNGNPAGISIEFRDGRYRTTITKIPWHLRRVVLSDEGTVLLAQEYDPRGREFAGPVFRVKRNGDRLTAGATLALPKRVNLYGFAPFTNQGRTLIAWVDDDGYLTISTASGEPLAVSTDSVGGTESSFEMNEETARGGESQRVYIKGRVEITSQGAILVNANSGISILGRLRMYTRSELKLFKLNGTNLREVWHTAPDKSYLADFKLINGKPGEPAKLATVVAFTTMNPLAERKAALRLYQLDTP